MRKLFVCLLMSLMFLGSYSQSTTDKVLTGVGSEVTALHNDTKDAISTLHQDASKIVETAYTDGKSVASILYEDVNKIVKYATPKLEAGLIVLAQTLKTTVAEVYTAMIRKQTAVAISDLCYGLIALLFGFLTYRIVTLPDSKLLYSKPDNYGNLNWKPQWIIGTILTIGGLIGFTIAFALHFQEMVMGFYAPKYGAIQEIVTLVNSLIK